MNFTQLINLFANPHQSSVVIEEPDATTLTRCLSPEHAPVERIRLTREDGYVDWYVMDAEHSERLLTRLCIGYGSAIGVSDL